MPFQWNSSKTAEAASQHTAKTQTNCQARTPAGERQDVVTHIDLSFEDVAGCSVACELDDPLDNSIIISPGLSFSLSHFFCLYIKHHTFEVSPGNALDCYVVAQADAEPSLE